MPLEVWTGKTTFSEGKTVFRHCISWTCREEEENFVLMSAEHCFASVKYCFVSAKPAFVGAKQCFAIAKKCLTDANQCV